jgi:hypothetical protein
MLAGAAMGASAALKAGGAQQIESRRAAVMARIAARQKADDIRSQGEAFAGQKRASYAKSGVLLDSGSPLLAVMDTVVSAEENALRTESQGWEQSRALTIQGKTQMDAAKAAAFSMGAGGASSALTMYGKAQSDAFKPSTKSSYVTEN